MTNLIPAVCSLVAGRYFDHMIVTSTLVVMVLEQNPQTSESPPTIWLQFLCDAHVTGFGEPFDLKSSSRYERAELIRRLYLLLGNEVRNVQLSEAHELSMTMADSYFTLRLSNDGAETEWQIGSAYPDVLDEADWLVSVDGDGALSMRLPSTT